MLSGPFSNRAFTIPCCTNRSLTLLCQRPKFPDPLNLIISNFADKIPDIVADALIPIVVAESPIDATLMKMNKEQTHSKSTEKRTKRFLRGSALNRLRPRSIGGCIFLLTFQLGLHQ